MTEVQTTFIAPTNPSSFVFYLFFIIDATRVLLSVLVFFSECFYRLQVESFDEEIPRKAELKGTRAFTVFNESILCKQVLMKAGSSKLFMR